MRRFMALHRAGTNACSPRPAPNASRCRRFSAQTDVAAAVYDGTQAFAGMPACFLSSTARV
jgi:hypothetical protein